MIGQLFGHCGVDPVGQCRVGGDQHRRRQGVVLRLRQQIRCHLIGLGGVVCDHQHFAWSRQGIDGHLAVHRLFRQGDVEVSGATDHVHLGNALAAVGHGGDSLGTSEAEHRFHAGQVGRCQHHGVHRTITSGGGTDHHVFDAGDPGWHRIHQHGAGVSRPSSGHVETRPLHRPPAPPKLFAVGARHRQIAGTLALVEVGDAAMGQLQGIPQVGRQRRPGLFEGLGGHRHRFGPEAIEPFGEVGNGGITAVAHRCENGFNPLTGFTLLGLCGAARQPFQLRLGPVQIPHDAKGSNGRLAHRQRNSGRVRSS